MIYVITNKINNHQYVGFTSKSLEERFNRHKLNSKNGNTYLYKAMRKYGIENFSISTLSINGTLNDEKLFIEKLKPEYNLTPGGDGGDMSQSSSFQLSMIKMHSSRSPKEYATFGMLGKTHSNETKTVMSDKRKKFWENTDRMKAGQKISGNKNGMFGKSPKNSIRVTINGVEYNSISEAVRATGLSPRAIKKDYV